MPLTKSQKSLLLDSFLFSNLGVSPDSFFASLEATGFASGEAIYTQSSFSRAIGFITKGMAVAESGDVPLNTLKAGDCFGVAALFTNDEQYVTTVFAKTQCEVVFIAGESLVELFQTIPQAALNYIAFLSDRIRFLNRKIAGFTVSTTEAGVVTWINMNAEGDAVNVKNGYSALARELNIGRTSLYRTLDRLAERGAIERAGKVIRILDSELL